MVQRAKGWFAQHASEVEGIRKVAETDIVHFRKMTVDREHAEAIQRKVERVLYSMSPEGIEEKAVIQNRITQGELDLDMATEFMDQRELKSKQTYNDELTIDYLERHYYLPVLYVSRGKKLDYIRHIIDVESESVFLGQVIAAKKQLAALDWWMFSKIDHTADAISIPYYDPKKGSAAAKFYPDFVFWGQKDGRYTILFVDPKGMEHASYQHKLDGFKKLFEKKGKPRLFPNEAGEVNVRLFLFNRGANSAPEGYKRYWRGSAAEIFEEAFFT